MVELSKDERRLVLFLCFFLISGTLIKLVRLRYPEVMAKLGCRRRGDVIFKNMSPADSIELTKLIDRSLVGTVDEPPEFPLDLNMADSGELQLLPGVGAVKAGEILTLRERIGTFRSVDELLEVKGIGPKTLEKLKPYVTVK